MPQLPSSAASSYLSPSRQMSPSRQLLPSRGKLRGLQQCLRAAHRGGALAGRWRGAGGAPLNRARVPRWGQTSPRAALTPHALEPKGREAGSFTALSSGRPGE